jgi:hypothetical protein
MDTLANELVSKGDLDGARAAIPTASPDCPMGTVPELFDELDARDLHGRRLHDGMLA